MIRFLAGWVAGVATLAGITVGMMAWEEHQIQRGVYGPRSGRR